MAQHPSLSRRPPAATRIGGEMVSLSIRDVLDLAGAGRSGMAPSLTIIDDGRIRLSGDGSRHCWQKCSDENDVTVYAWSDPAQRVMVTLSHPREAGAR